MTLINQRNLPAGFEDALSRVEDAFAKAGAPEVLASGTATLASGTLAITGLDDITVNAKIRLTYVGVQKGPVYVSAITAATGFTILSTVTSSNTSKVLWEVLAW